MAGTIDWRMYDEIVKECKELGIRKNKDYGTASLKLMNGLSIVVRINDKVARLNTLFELKAIDISVKDETIDDTLNDLINYAIYLKMLRRGGIS